MIKLSILKVGDKYAYMEYQTGNDPLVFNDTYGSNAYFDFLDVCGAIVRLYKDMEIIITDNTGENHESDISKPELAGGEQNV